MMHTLGSGQVESDTSKPIIHFGSPAADLIPFAAAIVEKEQDR